MEAQHRCVIKLRNIAGKSIDFFFHPQKQLPGSGSPVPVQHFQHPVCPKLFVILIDRFRNTIGIDKQLIIRIHYKRVFTVPDSRHDAERQAVFGANQFKRASGSADGGVLVSCIDRHAFTGRKIDQGKPYRGKVSGLIVFTQLVIYKGQNPRRTLFCIREIPDQRFCSQ